MFAVLSSLLLSGARLSCTDLYLLLSTDDQSDCVCMQLIGHFDFNLGFFIGFKVPVFNVIQVLLNLVKGISDLNRPFQII